MIKRNNVWCLVKFQQYDEVEGVALLNTGLLSIFSHGLVWKGQISDGFLLLDTSGGVKCSQRATFCIQQRYGTASWSMTQNKEGHTGELPPNHLLSGLVLYLTCFGKAY